MAFTLPLARSVPRAWKVKIRDRERLEPPHVTVINGTRAWRFDLRSRGWMDAEPDPGDVPDEVHQAILDNFGTLTGKWDQMYPTNPVDPKEDAYD